MLFGFCLGFLLGRFRRNQTLLLEGANSLRANLERHFFAVDNDSLSLEVWFPNFFGVALREADVAPELLALTGDVTLLHRFIH